MNAIILRAPIGRSPLDKSRRDKLKHVCMDAVASLMAHAEGQGERVDTGKRIVRYGATVLCHCFGLRATATYLQSLSGQIVAEADRFGEP